MNVPRQFSLVSPPVESLPYPAVPQVHLRAVESALTEAWRRLLERIDLSVLKSAHEDAITSPLVDELASMRAQGFDGFRPEVFAAVVKSDELRNRTGTSLWKKPDIIVHFQQCPPVVLEPRYYAVFIEAKILEPTKTIALYCKQGVHRFVDGDYAWKMREGMLCAYVLDGSRQAATLPTALAQNQLPPSEGPVPRAGNVTGLAEIADTVHPRGWAYTSPNKGVPGDIKLSHLWMRPV